MKDFSRVPVLDEYKTVQWKTKDVSRKDAAEYLHRAPKTLAEWSSTGKYDDDLPVFKFNGRCYYRKDHLDAFVDTVMIRKNPLN